MTYQDVILQEPSYSTRRTYQRLGAIYDNHNNINGSKVAQLIERNLEDVNILVIGDSTAAGTYSWPYKWATLLGINYPTHTVKWSLWDDASKTWGTQSIISVGTGTKIINLWNGSVGTKTTQYHLRWLDEIVVAVNPALILICHGHNQGYSSGYEKQMVRSQFINLTQSIAQKCPFASITLIGQNPHTDSDETGAIILPSVQDVATLCGYGYLDFYTPFIDYGSDWATDLMNDNVHPNDAGYTIQANVVNTAMENAKSSTITSQIPSSLFRQSQSNLLVNGDFSIFDGTNIGGWSLGNGVIVSADTVNYESKRARSVKLTADGLTVCSIYQFLSSDVAIPLRGQTLTFGARIMVNAGLWTSGMLLIDDDVNTTRYIYTMAHASEVGKFMWAIIPYTIAPTATSITVKIAVDPVAGVAANISVDRAFLIPGIMPLELPSYIGPNSGTSFPT